MQGDTGVRISERSNSADPKAVKNEGEEMLQAPEQRFPCSPWRRPW